MKALKGKQDIRDHSFKRLFQFMRKMKRKHTLSTIKKQKKKKGLLRLFEIAGSKKWWLFGSMLLAVCAAAALFGPYVAVYAILAELAKSAADPGAIDTPLIWKWGFASLGAVFVYGILLYAANMLSHIAAFTILYELRVAISAKLVRLPMGYFTKKASGDIKKIMSEDVERIELFVAHHIPDVTTAVVFPLLTLVFLFAVDWRLSLVVLGVFVAALVIQWYTYANPKVLKQYAAYHAALGRMNAGIVEYVRGIEVVKVFSRSLDPYKRLQTDIFAFRDYAVDITKSFAFTYTGFLTILSVPVLFLAPISVFLLLKAPVYARFAPTLFLFLILGTGVFFPLLKLMWIGGLLSQNTTGVELIDEILDTPEISEPTAPEKPADASVEFKNVTFAYDTTPVLKDISFVARPGTVTALVGPSGAGKSTVGMLGARFWDVSSGEILMGGVPVTQIATQALMNHVAFVFQENMLFFDTIEENIRMGDKAASMEQVTEAAKAAQCHEFIQNLEFGYQTLVGEGGIYLSGGEQQRIALARAILKNAPVVLLDEATAFADPENEDKILQSFSHLVSDKTVLVIAHRLSTITNADQILVLDKGKIVETGAHHELLAQDGLYARMWHVYNQSRQWVLNSKKENPGS